MAAFDLGELQAAAAQGREGLKRYREQQTALSGSQQQATDLLLQGIATRSGGAAGGQDYTRQVLEKAGQRGLTALGTAGDVAGQRQSGVEGQEGWLSSLSAAGDARASTTAQRIADAASLALQRSQGSFDTDLTFRQSETTKDQEAQRAALEQLLAHQALSFDEARQLAAAKAAAAAAQDDAGARTKYGGYASAGEQQAAARGFGVMTQQAVQGALAHNQHEAQFSQDQADMGYAAQAWLAKQKAAQAPVTAYGGIKGMASQLGPQLEPNGAMTGLSAGLNQARDAYQAQQAQAQAHPVGPAAGSSVFQQATEQNTGHDTSGLRSALEAYVKGAGQKFAGQVSGWGQAAKAGDAARTYAAGTESNQATMAALAQLMDTPDELYQRAGGVQAGMAPEVALGTFQMPTPGERLSTEKARRDQDYWDQYGTTYEDYQSSAARQATADQAAAKTQYDDAIGQLTGMDPNDLASSAGMTKAQLSKVVQGKDWINADTGRPVIDVIDVAIQTALSTDDLSDLKDLLNASGLSPNTRRVLRAYATKQLGYNPISKPSGN